jgi:predicted nucleic acid-binding protein
MGGNLIDLSEPGHQIPIDLAVDTSVVVALFQTFFSRSLPRQTSQATDFFRWLGQIDHRVILPPTGYRELLHVAVRHHYEQELKTQRENFSVELGFRPSSWKDLYKRRPSLLQRHAADLALIREGLIANNVIIAGPEDLNGSSVTSRQPFRELLVDIMVTYGLDSNDASILLEAQCLGLNAIVTMDQDLQRALPDFDIYTWLS